MGTRASWRSLGPWLAQLMWQVMTVIIVGLRVVASPLSPSPVAGEVHWDEVGRAEQISTGKVCTNWASEQRDLPRDVSTFIAGFSLYKVCRLSSSPLTAVPWGALCVRLSKILILSEWH